MIPKDEFILPPAQIFFKLTKKNPDLRQRLERDAETLFRADGANRTYPMEKDLFNPLVLLGNGLKLAYNAYVNYTASTHFVSVPNLAQSNAIFTGVHVSGQPLLTITPYMAQAMKSHIDANPDVMEEAGITDEDIKGLNAFVNRNRAVAAPPYLSHRHS